MVSAREYKTICNLPSVLLWVWILGSSGYEYFVLRGKVESFTNRVHPVDTAALFQPGVSVVASNKGTCICHELALWPILIGYPPRTHPILLATATHIAAACSETCCVNADYELFGFPQACVLHELVIEIETVLEVLIPIWELVISPCRPSPHFESPLHGCLRRDSKSTRFQMDIIITHTHFQMRYEVVWGSRRINERLLYCGRGLKVCY